MSKEQNFSFKKLQQNLQKKKKENLIFLTNSEQNQTVSQENSQRQISRKYAIALSQLGRLEKLVKYGDKNKKGIMHFYNVEMNPTNIKKIKKAFSNDPLRIPFLYMDKEIIKQCLVAFFSKLTSLWKINVPEPDKLSNINEPFIIKEFLNRNVSPYISQRRKDIITKTKILRFVEYIGFPYLVNLEKKEDLIDVCIYIIHILEKRKLYKEMLQDEYYAPPNTGYRKTKNEWKEIVKNLDLPDKAVSD